MKFINDKRFENAANTGIPIPSGNTVTVEIPVSSNSGFLHKVVVQQASGTSVGFTVDVLNRNVTTPASSVNISKIIPSQTGTSGNAMTWSSDIGVPFRAPYNKIYLRITLGSASNSIWDASVIWRTVDS